MEKCLFAVLFFPGVIPVVHREYHLIQQAKNWSDAQAYCRANFDDLATIESAADIVKLQSESLSKQFTSNAWSGLHKEKGGWIWSLGSEPLGPGAMWNPSALSTPNQGCAILSYYAGWWDTTCMDYYPFVCFDDRYIGSNRYILVNIQMKWYDAQAYCRQNHTDIASSRNSTEGSDLLGAMAGYASYIWIGLYRDPWRWSDQTVFSSIPWILGKPDNAKGNENCIYLYNGQAGDAWCSDLIPFFCERILQPRERQTIKIKVLSIQDVNDPVAKEAILDKIMQKVREHGLDYNTTLTWRVQPSGVVFHKKRTMMQITEQCGPP